MLENGRYKPEEQAKVLEAVRAWANSPEAKVEVEALVKHLVEEQKKRRAERRIDWLDLHRPCTI